MKDGYYKKINIIRVFLCIAVLLYHLDILKGGYLAVCAFFVLSGFLITKSSFDKDNFSIVNYYKSRFLKLYLPLLIVTFGTIAVISLYPDIFWLNLKPETTSVILGYNNFWQISSNLDYFSRSINSPFMHLWYMAIIMQFELIFPIIYILLKKVGEKINKCIPCILMSILSILGIVYFCYISKTGNMTLLYYSTFTRIFSLLIGVTLGLFVNYFGNKLVFMNNKVSNICFYAYLVVLSSMFIMIDNCSKYFVLCMILSSIISIRLIQYSLVDVTELNKFDYIVKKIASITYEVYLVQYPVIFLFQYVSLSTMLKIIVIVLLTIFISILIHFCINNKNKQYRVPQYLLIPLFLAICGYGIYQYYITEDHTKEMKQLQEQLVENQKLAVENQNKYKEQLAKENEDWNNILKDYENAENNMGEVVKTLNVVGIGDSVMLGAVDNLYAMFPNGYFDAKISRTAWVVGGIIENLVNKNMLGEPVIINLGANGDCSKSCKVNIIKQCEGRDIFWINTTNLPNVNSNLLALSKEYDNVHLIDWYTMSRGHEEYFYSDGIHLTGVGRKVYTEAIYNAIHDVYVEKYKIEKEKMLEEHELEEKNKITFYGNNILLNAYEYLESDFSNASFVINNGFNYNSLKKKLNEDKENNTLTYNIILAFDSSTNLSISEYESILDLLKDNNVLIVSSSKNIKDIKKLKKENIKIVNMYEEIKNNNDYLMADRLHLTDEGSKKMVELIRKAFN